MTDSKDGFRGYGFPLARFMPILKASRLPVAAPAADTGVKGGPGAALRTRAATA